jgi:hypothetical protein
MKCAWRSCLRNSEGTVVAHTFSLARIGSFWLLLSLPVICALVKEVFVDKRIAFTVNDMSLRRVRSVKVGAELVERGRQSLEGRISDPRVLVPSAILAIARIEKQFLTFTPT